ncbi:hypothetical protein K402DRAFT_389485 [Aulographum hederae CBS 113979]|uniref:Thioesterase/thiol ester dehydrase-isomerase n=1 Tax=Aulographum hederae CBS 113979 TaxID=1176131 RepID=A0A6G1HC16_9PEZI|nr:hypothetical protein K402DRAFT_389485 [Aulographum hederae CBS 113979]
MPAVFEVPPLAVVAAIGAGAAAMSSTTRTALFNFMRGSVSMTGWQWMILVLCLANYKNLPFIWHIRFLKAFFYQLYFQPTAIRPQSVFEPIITSTRAPASECDYNLHKSNSTYFSDFDIARTQLITAILRRGIRGQVKPSPEDEADFEAKIAKAGMIPADVKNGRSKSGGFYFALGAVSCHFKREVKPYERVEIWTRLMCWDEKWFYIVSHMVKAGTFKPERYSLQPWKRGRKAEEKKVETSEERKTRLGKAIFATSMAMYVVKKGRITVPPEMCLRNSGMMPPRPKSASPGSSSTDTPELVDSTADVMVESMFPSTNEMEDEWTWETVEKQRLRGMDLANKIRQLDQLYDTFDGGESGAMGEYTDWPLGL